MLITRSDPRGNRPRIGSLQTARPGATVTDLRPPKVTDRFVPGLIRAPARWMPRRTRPNVTGRVPNTLDSRMRASVPPMLIRTTIRIVWPPTTAGTRLVAADQAPTRCRRSVFRSAAPRAACGAISVAAGRGVAYRAADALSRAACASAGGTASAAVARAMAAVVHRRTGRGMRVILLDRTRERWGVRGSKGHGGSGRASVEPIHYGGLRNGWCSWEQSDSVNPPLTSAPLHGRAGRVRSH